MKVKSYKCPNCGGVVKFNNKNNKFFCIYCNEEYLEDLDNNKQIFNDKWDLNIYECKNCNNIEKSCKKLDKCHKCGSDVISKQIKIGGVVLPCVSLSEVENFYNNMLNTYSSAYSVETDILAALEKFRNSKISLKFLKATLYSGTIFLKRGNNFSERCYVFHDLPIIHDKLVNYKNLSRMSNVDVDIKSINYSKEQTKDVILKNDISFEYDRIYSDKDLIDACINDYLEEDIGSNKVTSSSNIETKEDIYLPFYFFEVLYEGKKYNNYICGYYSISKLNSILGTENNYCYFEFPFIEEKKM